MFQNADPNHFSLVEVMLDKGVSERELNEDEKPWLIVQKKRRVSVKFAQRYFNDRTLVMVVPYFIHVLFESCWSSV